ncbi:bestrophin-like domain [Nonomuraea sediminis]|uniref:bestrophin-like domain n=1 Tax=Nonomuraea sediminis TaxID=2835864 RepID=UPI001BDC0E47|nr:DUF4239 domain-containing protein [Nonomuraea sediminis]
MVWFLVAAAVAVLLVALVVLRRRGRRDEEHGPAALDFAVNLALAVYLLVLAYAAVLGHDAIQAAETDAAAEAESLTELYWAVAPLPEAAPIRAQVCRYTTQAVALDWPLMPKGELSSVPGETLDDLRIAVQRLHPEGITGLRSRSDALGRAADISHARGMRADDAASSLDPVFLISMIASGALVIVLPWLAGVKPSAASITSDLVRVGVVVVGIVVIVLLAKPYSGPGAVRPDAFQAAQRQFDAIDRHVGTEP